MIQPSILSTKEAHEYVGGIKIWQELLALYHKTHLKPFRTMPRGDQFWTVAKIDAVVRIADMEGALNDRRKVEKALEEFRKLTAASTTQPS